MNYTREQIAAVTDIAVLRPDALPADILPVALAVEPLGLASICVAPIYVATARRYTSRVCAVVSFPHGNTLPAVKAHEAAMAIAQGATEIDFVMNYGRFLAGDSVTIEREMLALVEICKPRILKVILETCYFSRTMIERACRLAVDCGVDFVKTSTGFASGGATPEAVKTMISAVDGRAQVKASGGIKTYADACTYLDLGCTRLGIGSTSYEHVISGVQP